MTKQQIALKLALEALKELRMLGMNAQWHDSWLAKPNEAITAIREALAEQLAQDKPLTNEQRREIQNKLGRKYGGDDIEFDNVVFSIESAHGITGERK